MAKKFLDKNKGEFEPGAYQLGVNFVIKSLDTASVGDSEETEEVITIEGYANFAGSCADDEECFIDRTNDVVVPTGIDVSNYKKSPVILFQHNRNYVIGKAVTVTKKKDGLFIKAEIHAGACEDEDFYAIKNGLYTSFSIGFRTKAGEYKPVGDNDVFFITKSELLEVSIVSIPCNTSSTFNLVKSYEGNIYAGEINFSETPSNTKNVVSNTVEEEDARMKVKFRDMLSEDKVKELEAMGLGEALDELKEIDTKSFIETLIAKQFASLEDKLKELIAESTKTDEPASEEPAAEEAAATEGEVAPETETEPAKEDEVQEEKEVDVEDFKALSDSIATLKALVSEEK